VRAYKPKKRKGHQKKLNAEGSKIPVNQILQQIAE
jgi:hypothetical protein